MTFVLTSCSKLLCILLSAIRIADKFDSRMHFSDTQGNVPMNWIMLYSTINLAQEFECKSKSFLHLNKFMQKVGKKDKINKFVMM